MNFLKKMTLIFACVSLCFMITSCGILGWSFPEQIAQSKPDNKQDYGLKNDMPLTFAVYPFKNVSNDVCAGFRARRAAQGEFSVIGECKPLNAVDKLVNKHILTINDAVKVGRELGVDAVVVGEVTKQTHYWHIFSKYNSVNVKLWIYSTKTGKCIWSAENGATNFDLNPLGVIGLAIDNYYWTRGTEELYHRATSDMVYSIKPTAYYTRVKPIPPASLEIQ